VQLSFVTCDDATQFCCANRQAGNCGDFSGANGAVTRNVRTRTDASPDEFVAIVSEVADKRGAFECT
jgi:hypothetical protein